MAGVTDRPFRQLCRRLGAGMTVSEMVSANALLWGSTKTLTRIDHRNEPEPRIVQIVGAEPQSLAEAALINVQKGAHIIDINMGCPAKKVCNKAAGSALLRDETLVDEILQTVVAAVKVPVTLKIRTGWDPENRNAIKIAELAERAGVAALTIHGRTRADAFKGHAEYDTIRAVKQSVNIPIIANGDISSPQVAKNVLNYTNADGIMIGRAAQGNPWIFQEVEHYIETGSLLPAPSSPEVCAVLCEHLTNLYALYGEHRGVRVARKHIAWYCKNKPGSAQFRNWIMKLESSTEQLGAVTKYFKNHYKNEKAPQLAA